MDIETEKYIELLKSKIQMLEDEVRFLNRREILLQDTDIGEDVKIEKQLEEMQSFNDSEFVMYEDDASIDREIEFLYRVVRELKARHDLQVKEIQELSSVSKIDTSNVERLESVNGWFQEEITNLTCEIDELKEQKPLLIDVKELEELTHKINELEVKRQNAVDELLDMYMMNMMKIMKMS
jgi:hypothetical protein